MVIVIYIKVIIGHLDIKFETWDSNVLSYITSTTMSLANWGEKKPQDDLHLYTFFFRFYEYANWTHPFFSWYAGVPWPVFAYWNLTGFYICDAITFAFIHTRLCIQISPPERFVLIKYTLYMVLDDFPDSVFLLFLRLHCYRLRSVCQICQSWS